MTKFITYEQVKDSINYNPIINRIKDDLTIYFLSVSTRHKLNTKKNNGTLKLLFGDSDLFIKKYFILEFIETAKNNDDNLYYKINTKMEWMATWDNLNGDRNYKHRQYYLEWIKCNFDECWDRAVENIENDIYNGTLI